MPHGASDGFSAENSRHPIHHAPGPPPLINRLDRPALPETISQFFPGTRRQPISYHDQPGDC